MYIDQHVDTIDPQVMDIALLDLSIIESVQQSRAPIEALQGAKALNAAYQIWMKKMRVLDDPRGWEFQQDSQVCGYKAADNMRAEIFHLVRQRRPLCLAGVLESLVRICPIC